MNFADIFKKSFLEGYASSRIDVAEIIICMLITVLIAAYIFMVYRILNRNAFYNRNFNLSLIALAVITAAIILTIQSNIVISLGMVGALSIVRFRTAIKDPMDLVFLFWAISIGIICGAGFAIVAVIASVIITVIVLLFERISVDKAAVILLVNTTDYKTESQIMNIVESHCSMYKVKARNLTKTKLDMAVEVKTDKGAGMVEKLMDLECVTSASLVDHDGEVTF
ncbi:MAG: DUF4956 domain-containing protein [Lachnospiraceae bacterium]|nr:DUF4956 domain-containing protein [Oscillospiraceae bacterium]MBP3476351.1 DUF4956 domain-containing protein [Lachnospiraceae bacterium]